MRAEMAKPDGAEEAEERTLSLEAHVSQVVVRSMKDVYGRGPTHAKTFFCDEIRLLRTERRNDTG